MAGIVIDTNVLLDVFVFADPRSMRLWQALAASTAPLRCLRSAATDAGLAEVLARPTFAARLGSTPATADQWLARWRELATPVERIFAAPWHCTDRQDQKFLDLASTARAAFLVSKDKALLRVDRRSRRDGLRVLMPGQMLASCS